MSLLANHGILRSLGVAYDADAQAFFDQIELVEVISLSTTIKDAVNTLVVDSKSAGIWSKCIAIYPLVGGDPDSHKYNLIDTTQFTLTWDDGGSGNHTAAGVQSAGAEYGLSGIIPSTHLTKGSFHHGVYVDDFGAVNGGVWEMGSYSFPNMCALATASNSFGINAGFVSGVWHYDVGRLNVANGGGGGLALASRESVTSHKGYLNGSLVDTETADVTSQTLNSYEIYLGALNNVGAASGITSKSMRYFTIGTGLTPTECSDYTTIIQAFQTALSRDV
jgi:hypothetical protein